MDFKNILHNKLFLYGGGLLLLIVLFVHLKGSNAAVGNGVTTSTTSGPTDAQVAAQVSLATAQIGAASHANDTNANMAVAIQTLQEQLAEKSLDADTARYALDVGLKQSTYQIDAAAAAQERDDQLQANLAALTLNTQRQMEADNQSFQLAYANNANQTQIANTQIIAGVTLASIQANRDVTVAGFQAQTQQQANMIAGQVQISDGANAVAIAQSNNQASVAKHGQTTGLLGGILGIFSDRRLKRDVVYLGTGRDGLGRYAYRYHDSRHVQVGVMADEVARRRPAALGPIIEGHATVRYHALAG